LFTGSHRRTIIALTIGVLAAWHTKSCFPRHVFYCRKHSSSSLSLPIVLFIPICIVLIRCVKPVDDKSRMSHYLRPHTPHSRANFANLVRVFFAHIYIISRSQKVRIVFGQALYVPTATHMVVMPRIVDDCQPKIVGD
jgi:hypothetical protein